MKKNKNFNYILNMEKVYYFQKSKNNKQFLLFFAND